MVDNKGLAVPKHSLAANEIFPYSSIFVNLYLKLKWKNIHLLANKHFNPFPPRGSPLTSKIV